MKILIGVLIGMLRNVSLSCWSVSDTRPGGTFRWVDIPVRAETPEQAEWLAKRQALRVTEWQRLQTAKPYRTRLVVPPANTASGS